MVLMREMQDFNFRPVPQLLPVPNENVEFCIRQSSLRNIFKYMAFWDINKQCS